MNDINLDTLEYWAEEYLLPLYLLTDPYVDAFREDFLCLTENNTSTMYFLDNRYELERKKGEEFFSKKDYLKIYEKEVNTVGSDLAKYKLSGDIEKDFFELMRQFGLWAEVYVRTEACRTVYFEGKEDKVMLKHLDKLGKLRFQMREFFDNVILSNLGIVIDQISQKFGLDANVISYYTYQELEDLFRSGVKVELAVLDDRKKGFIFRQSNNETSLITGIEFSALKEQINRKFSYSKLDQLMGTSASRGVVSGIVRIVVHDSPDISDQIA